MIPTGNGMFVWQIPRCGNVQAMADLAKLSGVGHVLIKIANGYADSGVIDGVDYARSLALALQKNGIEAWGWQYLYSTSPGLEAAKAIERIIETGVTGFVIDAEAECKGRPDACYQYCTALRSEMSGMPIGLSSYRYPSLHPQLPWAVLRSFVDFDMPQVYWMLAHNPGDQLRRSFAEFSKMTPKLPFVPTGAAFTEYGWTPTVGEVQAFMLACGELGLRSFNWWEWYQAKTVVPALWPAIYDYHAPAPVIGDEVRVTASGLYVRSAPVVDMSTVIGTTSYGKIWKVTGRVKDAYGREWVQSGPSAHLAGWLCEDV
jgi:hypothetical protein